MFYPHLAEIDIERDEPAIDPKREARIVSHRNAILAEQIVTKDLIRKRKKTSKVSEKVRALLEFDERFKSARHFMELWNFWREFYFDVGPIHPKNKSQLTCIEKIIEMAGDKKMNLSVLIGATHKAYVWRKVRPGFSETLSKGADHYENYSDQVSADLDRREYEEGALS